MTVFSAGAGIVIEDAVDSKAWSAGLEAMVRRLDTATGEASVEAAKLIQMITRMKLNERSHDELSWSPSPPGSPPARVSGALSASIMVKKSGPFSALVGPTTRYGRIQELGGDMHGHPYMVWRKLMGDRVVKFRRSFVHLPGRPYLKPATEAAVNSGSVRRIYADYWARAIEG